MNRREFLSSAAGFTTGLGSRLWPAASGPELAITIDDLKPDMTVGISGREINSRILNHLDNARLKVALFVTGMRIDNPAGAALVAEWDAAKHLICNHTYSHRSYNTPGISFEWFSSDVDKNEPLIRRYKHFTPLFRYPALKEGDTIEKRDRFRKWLRSRGYRVGHVTVDASDWYIDSRLASRLEKAPAAETAAYRDYYIAHIRDRAAFYRQLAKDVLSHEVRHTLLIHHNLLNSLYLGDLLKGLEQDGWKLIGADAAFQDPVFRREPKTLPAGESLVWALAKETGNFESRLRYPGEDDVYEKPKMDAAGL